MSTKSIHPRDYIGDQIANILSYRNIISSWSKKAPPKDKPDGRQKIKAIIRNYITNKCQQGIGTLDNLAKQCSSRKTAAIDNRTIKYFKSIFPAVKRCLRGYNPECAGRFYYEPIMQAIDAAQQLLELERFFLEPPESWDEAKLFKKEMLYAQRLETNPHFIADINQLSRTYKKIFSKVNRDIYINMDYAEKIEAEYDDIEDLPVQDRFKYELAILCYRYCLAGLTKDLKPIPLPFQIQLDGCIARLTIPNYMEIDWKRDIPGDVIRYIQKHGTFASSIRPQRLSKQDRRWPIIPRDIDILKRYQELMQQRGTSREKNKNWVYDTLCKEFPITLTEGPDDRRKVCRRRIKRISGRLNIS